jgi:FMN phosphatase YigB (HAD superfamily)
VPAPLKAIFFDVGNTLLFPDRTHILAPLHERKLTPSLDQWHAIERKTKKEFDEILQHDGKADHSFWYLFYSHLLEELDINDAVLRDVLVSATRVSAN